MAQTTLWPTNLWIGTNGALASIGSNWSLGHSPSNAESVFLDTDVSNMTWNAAATNTVASWTQTANYIGTVTFATVFGTNGFTNFTVSGDVALNGGAWTHTGNGSTEANRLRVAVGGNLLITNATITADLLGYSSGAKGPGGSGNSGAAYGGASGRVNSGTYMFNQNTYGSIFAPTNLGSGGGIGGGAILLTVAGTTTVASAGMISANGQGSTYSSMGGSGGSVYLTTGWLTGSGTLQANGGPGIGGIYGGGGGRVAIILTGPGADFGSWNGTNTAYGGTSTAAAGTVYRKTKAGVDTLIIDNNGISIYGQVSTLMPPTPNAVNLNAISNVVIKNKGILGVRGDTTLDLNTFNPTIYGAANSAIAIDSDTNVTYPSNWIIDNYTVYANNITKTPANVTIGTNGILAHYFNGSVETYKVNLTISGNLTVLSNGTITADGLGYSAGQGPGGGSGNQGAAYGGMALSASTTVNPNTYGSIIAPTNMGSGVGGSGGGAVLLTVAGTTTVASAGTITANGQAATYSSQSGAGGSVYLTTGWLTGSGTLQANGGAGISGLYGSGGGRVAIVLSGSGANFTLWTGKNTTYGGTPNPAAAGTIYRKMQADKAGAGTVIVNNGATAMNATYTSLPAFSNSTENISQTAWMTTNNVRLGLAASTNIASLTLNANGSLELNGKTLVVKALTVTNKVYKSGTYGPNDTPIPALTDSVGGGKVIIKPSSTVVYFR